MKNPFLPIIVTVSLFGFAAAAVAAGDPAAGKEKSATCAACHNADGNSTNPQWPKLAGQNAAYLEKQLQNFKAGANPDSEDVKRINATMNGMAAALSDQDMQDLAAYFSNQQITPGQADPELVELGKEIYHGGNLSSGVSACAGCHGPQGKGNPAAGFPSLAGQHAEYTMLQLKAFRSWERANDPGQMMRNIASKLTDREIAAVASYIQGLQ